MIQPATPPPTTTPDRDIQRFQHYATFLRAIQRLYETGRGDVAILRRNADKTLSEARGLTLTLFYPYLEQYFPADAGRRDARKDNLCLLTAALMTFDRQVMLADKMAAEQAAAEWLKPENKYHDFGAILAKLRSDDEKKAFNEYLRDDKGNKKKPPQTPLERRLAMLLDSAFNSDGSGEMAFRLRQNVKLAVSKKAFIHWPLLLADLQDWNRFGRPVQKRWARSFYVVPDAAANSGESEMSDPAL